MPGRTDASPWPAGTTPIVYEYGDGYGTVGMNDNYKGLLSDDDKRIKEVLRELQATRRSTSPSDDVCAAVDAFLRQLGG